MFEDLASIMEQLKTGQIIIDENKTAWAFIEPKKKRAVVKNLSNNKRYFLKGPVEVTNDIDEETVNEVEEEVVALIQAEQKAKKMQTNQVFIGEDDKEYIFLEFKNGKLYCLDKNNKKSQKSPLFVKHILGKIAKK